MRRPRPWPRPTADGASATPALAQDHMSISSRTRPTRTGLSQVLEVTMFAVDLLDRSENIGPEKIRIPQLQHYALVHT